MSDPSRGEASAALGGPMRRAIDAAHPAFAGHFPGRPLLPGVSVLAEVIEAALTRPALAQRLGPAPRLVAAKFLSPVLPGDALDLLLTPTAGGLDFTVQCGERLVARGQFADGAAP